MKIAQKYSHLNGEEYLIVHHKKILKEIYDVIEEIDASMHMTKESKEKTKKGKLVYNPSTSNLPISLFGGSISLPAVVNLQKIKPGILKYHY